MSLTIGTRTVRLVQNTRSFFSNARGAGRDIVELAKLEAQLAASSAVSVALFSAIALILAFTGWILLVGAAVAWIADNWLSLPLALLIIALVMLVGMVGLFHTMRRTFTLLSSLTEISLRSAGRVISINAWPTDRRETSATITSGEPD